MSSVPQLSYREEHTDIGQDTKMSSPNSAQTAHKGKRRSLIGRIFRYLFGRGKKRRDLRNPGEIIGEDLLHRSEEEAKATRGIKHVPADDMDFNRVPESGNEIAATTDEEESDIEMIEPNTICGTLVPIASIVSELRDELEISSSTKSVCVGGRRTLSWSICLTRYTETADSPETETSLASETETSLASETETSLASETESSLASETESTGSSDDEYVLAEEPDLTPCVGVPTEEISIPTENIPESGIEITATLDSQPESEADLPVPLSLKSFKFHKVLGEGFYGKVFLASHRATNQLLAIKRVKKTSAPLERHKAEREIQEEVGGSRFFPEMYATFQTKEYLFFVMEHVSGETLEDFIEKRHPLDLNTIRFIAAEVVCAMQALHSRGFTHRHLNITNILIDSAGHVRVVDFGLAEKKTSSYEPDNTTITDTMADVEPWYDYLRDYRCFHKTLVYLGLNLPSDDKRHPQLNHLLRECKSVRRNLRQHPFFAGIDWEDLEAGNVRPPYVMPPSRKVNRARRIMVKGKRFLKGRRRPAIDMPGFDFLSNRWEELLQHQ